MSEPAAVEAEELETLPQRIDWTRCQSLAKHTGPLGSIRDADWCDREYLAGIVTLVDGVGELHEYMDMGQPHDTYIHRLMDVAYGDVDGDGATDAAVLLHSESYAGGNSWKGADIFLFTLRAGAVVDLGSEPASLAENWALSVGDGVVMMQFSLGAKTCVDRWTFANAKLTFSGATRCIGP